MPTGDAKAWKVLERGGLCSGLLLLGLSTAAWAVPEGQAAAAERGFLREAVAGTPYSALVVHTGVDIAPSAPRGKPDAGFEERHTYRARVLETFRGAAHPHIRYEAVVERGDSAQIDTRPQIVTLCKGPRGFYWPGTGASFPGDAETVSEARRLGRRPPAAGAGVKPFPHCD